MFEVISFGTFASHTEYLGTNWVQALKVYGRVSSQGVHVIVWEGQVPVREFHPTLGYTGSNFNHPAVVISL